jgi:lipoprotein-anchoring transpeptidase ErfK/SrfK
MGRTKRRRSYGLVWALVLLLFLCELTIGGGLALWYTSDIILPGVQALSVDLGRMTRGEAGLALRNIWQARTITVQAGNQTWTLPVTQLGYQLNADKMAALAASQGRTPESVWELLRQRTPAPVESMWTFDPEDALAALRPLVAPLEVPAQDAAVRIVGAEVEHTPSAVGQAVDLAGGMAYLEQHAAQVLADQRLDLAVVQLQPKVVDLTAAAVQAQQLLSRSIPIALYDPLNNEHIQWTITPEEIGGVLALEPGSDPAAGPQWVVDEVRLKDLLRQKSETLGAGRFANPQETLPPVTRAITGSVDAPIKLRVYHEAKEHVVKFGETLSSIAEDYGIPYPWIQAANPAVGDSLRAGQDILIPSQDEMIPLTPVENKRIIVGMKAQRLQAFENGEMKWDWQISTGIASSPTSPGIFQVQGRDPNAYATNWDLWMPWFVGFYRPVPTSDFMNGFHGFPKRGGTQLLWVNSLGKPATYGCVLTNTDNAKLLYDWAEDGVIVEVRRE